MLISFFISCSFSLEVETLNIYPPDTGLKKLVNTLHIKTKPSTVRKYFIYSKNGINIEDTLSRLRRLEFIQDAEYKNNKIKTLDRWSLNLGGSISKEANLTTINYGITETNLLGYGITASINKTIKESNHKIEETLFEFRDRNILGSNLMVYYNSSGIFELEKELNSFENMSFLKLNIERGKYLEAGYRILNRNRKSYYIAGGMIVEDNYKLTGFKNQKFSLKEITSNFVGFTAFETTYHTFKNLRSYEKNEDINTGLKAKILYDGSSLYLNLAKGFMLNDYINLNRFEYLKSYDEIIGLTAEFIKKLNETVIDTKIAYSEVIKKTGSYSLILDASRGMRGFNTEEILTDRFWLINIETRKLILFNSLDLFSLGIAFFIDMAYTDGWYLDYGFGFRVASNKFMPDIGRIDIALRNYTAYLTITTGQIF